MRNKPKKYDSVIEMLTDFLHCKELEVEELKAKVEYLTEAGDALMRQLDRFGKSDNASARIREWKAAKDGNNSK